MAMTRQNVEMLRAVISVYYEYEPCGGSLHAYLDDGNYSNSVLEFCRDYAKENGDRVGELIATQLLEAPPEFHAWCGESFDGWDYAMVNWIMSFDPC